MPKSKIHRHEIWKKGKIAGKRPLIFSTPAPLGSKKYFSTHSTHSQLTSAHLGPTTLLEIIKFLATEHPELINTVEQHNSNGLHLASQEGHSETFMYLIETLKMDPAVNDRLGRNSFIYACVGGSLEIVEYLATKHPELINTVDGRDDDGLHLASREGNLETFMYLIETLKMDPTVKNDHGHNSFFHACYGGKLEIVKYLATKHPEPGTV